MIAGRRSAVGYRHVYCTALHPSTFTLDYSGSGLKSFRMRDFLSAPSFALSLALLCACGIDFAKKQQRIDGGGAMADANGGMTRDDDAGADPPPDANCENESPRRSCGACPAGYVGNGVSDCVPGLTGLLLSTGTLVPAFDISVTAYSVVLPVSTQSIALTPGAPFGAAITVLNQAVTSGQPWPSPILNLNDNLVTIVVSQSGRPSRTYTVTLTRGTQQAFVKARNAESSDNFGSSVAI